MKRSYTIISNVSQWREYQRRYTLHRRIKWIARIVGIVAFICFLFTAGGLEDYSLTVKEAVTRGTIELVLIAASMVVCRALD